MSVKPIVKWVGGKSQIIDDVLDSFPIEMNNYFEPFLGGGSILLGLLEHIRNGKIKIRGKIYASDINMNLIALYQNIQRYADAFIDELIQIIEEFTQCDIENPRIIRDAKSLEEALTSQESYYFWIRSQFNRMTQQAKQTLPGSAMLLFMNKTCFRGVYREGPNGFNVPFGNYKNPSIFDADHVRQLSIAIKDVVFSNCSFENALENISSGDFAYLDPPYVPVSKTSFVSYTSGGFSEENHHSLFEFCNQMNERGIKFVMSNADAQLVRNSFIAQNYVITTISCKRSINSKHPDAKENELLIRNY